MSSVALLDNVIWHALSGPQARYSSGTDDVRRYVHGFSPIIGFANPANPNFRALSSLCAPNERLYTDVWSGPVPSNWQLDVESTMFKMIWDGETPAADEAPEAVPLGKQHAHQALELASLTRPGPFGLRTIELGDYFGYFERERLIAMAGERLHAGALREISGVCTHPDFRRRGLAERLMRKLIRRHRLRGETPFLHVMRDNGGARRLYEQMGFRNYLETVVRIIALRA
jgi:GNAT superfamily N-acetyltransferase